MGPLRVQGMVPKINFYEKRRLKNIMHFPSFFFIILIDLSIRVSTERD